MKKFRGIMAIILSLLLLSLNVQAADDKQPKWPGEALKRNGSVVNADYDGNFFVPKDKYTSDDLNTYDFTSKTTFEGNEEKAKKILEAAKNPGLGVRGLHKQGITGKGVSIAYIGYGIQNGDLKSFTHPEFRDGMIKEYVNIGQGGNPTRREAYTTISALAGKTVGTAPDANLYILGMNVKRGGGSQWKPMTDGINWVIEKNKTLSGSDKIRVIVIDTPPGGDVETWRKWQPIYDEAVAKAQKAGIIVLGPRWHDPAEKPQWGDPQPISFYADDGYYDPSSPDDVSKAKYGWPSRTDWYTHKIFVHVPTYGRTFAIENNSYARIDNNFTSESYLAGIIAMGYQVNPNLSNTQMVKLLINTKTNSMVNPPKFIEAVKKS